jgi:hypothetical protein
LYPDAVGPATGRAGACESDGDLDVGVDLVYKKGRMPDSIRRKNNPVLTEEVERLVAS